MGLKNVWNFVQQLKGIGMLSTLLCTITSGRKFELGKVVYSSRVLWYCVIDMVLHVCGSFGTTSVSMRKEFPCLESGLRIRIRAAVTPVLPHHRAATVDQVLHYLQPEAIQCSRHRGSPARQAMLRYPADMLRGSA